jgi:Uncharacterised nucleotidyltransferase
VSEVVSGAAARLVIAATREPDPGAAGDLASAAAVISDWSEVVELAIRNGVAAYVRRALRPPASAPAAALEALRHAELASVAAGLVLDATLRTVVDDLAGLGIASIVLKGPVVARTIYPEQALRPYGDIDLVVRLTAFEPAAEALLRLGFREVPYEAEIARSAFAGAGAEEPFHRMFVDRAGRALIELHADPLQLGLRPATENERWQRAVGFPDIGPRALALSDEDQVIQLAVHVHKHGFSRLIWTKDLDLFVRARAPSLDWDLVGSIARREGVAASVWFALSLARELLGTPETPARDLAPALPVRALYELIWPRRRIAGLEMTMRRRAVQFHAAESWRGMVPTIVLMGRRRERVRLVLRSLLATASTKSQPRERG